MTYIRTKPRLMLALPFSLAVECSISDREVRDLSIVHCAVICVLEQDLLSLLLTTG